VLSGWRFLGFAVLRLEQCTLWNVARLSGLRFFRLSRFRSTAVGPCPGRDFISFSNGEKETEAKKTPFHQWL